MSLFVKICGLANAADVAAVAALRPDALGFVFWPRSPRAVTPEQVAGWTRALPPGLLKVGVFVDPAPEDIRRAVDRARLDVVQWHGFPVVSGQPSAASQKRETEFFQGLEKMLSGISKPWNSDVGGAGSPAHTIKVWQVVHIGHESASVRCVDALVLDSYSPAAPGGTGQTVDWTVARAFVAASRTRVLLAGGLRAENVAEALRVVRPWGVDVSSGVEARPGRKQLDAVQRFIETCRAH
ncbi:MAG: phosphoribosylanthranilate isomerase [Kiritimatiellaeota bacterium]|nr:phosphoribosylanthranilate isomerase [Kiritimatiellota bacterium]